MGYKNEVYYRTGHGSFPLYEKYTKFSSSPRTISKVVTFFNMIIRGSTYKVFQYGIVLFSAKIGLRNMLIIIGMVIVMFLNAFQLLLHLKSKPAYIAF